jgi:type VI protein secretion system component Hcp
MRTVAVAGTAILGFAGGAAAASSDFFLKIEGVQGESAAGETIEVQSFSWGASNPSTVGSGGLSAGRVVAPRDPPSGQSTGQRQRAAVADTGVTTAAAAPAVDQMASFNVAFRESPTRASTGSLARACATGKHIPSAVLSVRGVSYTLTDVVVSSCTAEGEMRRAELKGHVTLIK